MSEYEKSFEIMKRFARLPKIERNIVELLFEHDSLDCTYSSLANMLKMDIPNVRNALLHLEKLGVVYIVKEKTHKRYKPMVACFLIDDWMNYLLQNTYLKGEKLCLTAMTTAP